MTSSRWLLALLVAVLIYGAFAAGVIPHWRKYQRIASRGQKTEATITAIRPRVRSSVTYRFTVGTQTYTGMGSPRLTGAAEPLTPKVGATLPVTYWTDDPSVSTPSNAARLLTTWSLLLFGILPAVAAIAGWVATSRKAAARHTAAP